MGGALAQGGVYGRGRVDLIPEHLALTVEGAGAAAGHRTGNGLCQQRVAGDGRLRRVDGRVGRRVAGGDRARAEGSARADASAAGVLVEDAADAPWRSVRVAEQIHQELAQMIAREVKDPRIGMVTLTGVEITVDYAHATVHFTTLPDGLQFV